MRSRDIKIDSVIAEKSKAHPAIQGDTEFYPRLLLYLMQGVISSVQPDKAIVITDRMPVKHKRGIMEKAVKILLDQKLPGNYLIAHHPSGSHYGLQIADYCCWAVFRKWERGDFAGYSLIRPMIKGEFDLFGDGGGVGA